LSWRSVIWGITPNWLFSIILSLLYCIFKLIRDHSDDIKVGRTKIDVGKRMEDGKGETVVAIFEIKDWYLVCTKSWGALKGHPQCVSEVDVVEVVEFNISELQ
jgi:hypothetical protein